jgi:transcriptional regulator with XRE-family HTH domain
MSCSKSEFARRLGVSRSYVRKLELAGRLVLVEGGRIDPEASLAKIRETASPGRAGIHEQPGGPAVAPDDDYRHWRNRREAALADEAELSYSQAAGVLMAVEVADQVFTDRGTLLRARVEQIPERCAWSAAAGTLAADLAAEVERILADLDKPLDLSRWQATR